MITRLLQFADSASSDITKNFNNCGTTCPNANTLGSATIPAITNLILYIAGAAAINPSAVNDAKNTILYSVIGLAIAVSAYAIVNYVLTAFKL